MYAAIVQSRIDVKPLDLESALKRAVAMIISRLRAYGYKWKQWIAKTKHQRDPGIIPRSKRNKRVMTQEKYGDYTIHPAILQAASDLNLTG